MNAWGIGLIAGFTAIGLMGMLKYVNAFKHAKVQTLRKKISPLLEFIAMAGVGVVAIDWALGWFGWSMRRIFNNLVGWLASLGSGHMSPSSLRTGMLILLGFVLVGSIINVFADSLVPKFQVNGLTHASAIAAAVIPSLAIAHGFVGSFMHNTGDGLGGALATFGSSIVGG